MNHENGSGQGDVERLRQVTHKPEVWLRVPPRHRYFTGRSELLERLREGLAATITAVVPHTLHGLGGVGKTQLAVEYVYRYQHLYDLIAWIPAEQPALIGSSVANLAPRLGMPSSDITGVEEALAAVLEALRIGSPYDRWLLVFDNADTPESLMPFVPTDGPGDVLITSRNGEWSTVYDTLTVDVFEREESAQFLRQWLRKLAEKDADSLAEALGDLPLALEQAAALLVQTGMPVPKYLELLEEQTGPLFEENLPSAYPLPVTATWAISVSQLSEELPEAVEVLRLCAFFGPEPIPRDVLSEGYRALDPPYREILQDPLLLARAIRGLGWYALARLDDDGPSLNVHRLVQAVVRYELDEQDRRRLRHNVQLLLAEVTPRDPDNAASWPRFAELLPHIGPAGVVASTDPKICFLTRSIVRYLYRSGNYPAAVSMARQALKNWSEDPNIEQADLSAIKRHLGISLREVGNFREAFELNEQALEEAIAEFGPDHDEPLRIMNSHGADYRTSGDFLVALEFDRASVSRHLQVLGENDIRTCRAQHNLAVDLALTGHFDEAMVLNQRVYQAMRDIHHSANHPELLGSLRNMCWVIRLRGDYREARELGQELLTSHHQVFGPDHHSTLKAAKDLAIAMRLAEGGTQGVVEDAENVLRRYQRILGEGHTDSLGAAVAFENALRESGRVAEATQMAERTLEMHSRVYGPDHPFTLGCQGNLALLRRLAGQPERARELHEDALTKLRTALGPDHYYALTCAIGLAGDLAALGRRAEAAELGRQTLSGLRGAELGEDHPATLACAFDLSLDLAALGEDDEARALNAETLERYRRTQGPDYQGLQRTGAGERLDVDFDPPPF